MSCDSKKRGIIHVFSVRARYLSEPIIHMIEGLRPEEGIYCYRNDVLAGQSQGDNSDHLYAKPGILLEGALWRKLARWHITGLFGIVSMFLPQFSFLSIVRLMRLPRRMVIHGFPMSLPTVLLLRLLGKRIVLIHWGGLPHGRSLCAELNSLAYNYFDKIFVLMSPEERFFSKYSPANGVATLPYYSSKRVRRQLACDPETANKLIIGNSGYCMDGYEWLIENIRFSNWQEVTWMLNYGASFDVMESFKRRTSARFGETQVKYWTTVVPIDEYLKVVAQSPFYICPARTQSGLGAIYSSISCGKAIFLRGDNYLWIKSLGIRVGNLDEISEITPELMRSYLPEENEIANNLKRLRDRVSYGGSGDKWISEIENAFVK